jgi:hypothetical protein
MFLNVAVMGKERHVKGPYLGKKVVKTNNEFFTSIPSLHDMGTSAILSRPMRKQNGKF